MRDFLFRTDRRWLSLGALAVFFCFLAGCQLWPTVRTENNESKIVLSPRVINLSPATQLKTRIQDLVEEEKQAVILNFGDLMLDRNVQKQISATSSDYLFEKIAYNEWYLAAEVVSANLEGPFADKRRATSKSIAFRFDPKLVPTLKKYKLTMLSQANNHSFDMGMAGFDESKKNLRAGGINFYGSQYKVDDNSLLIKKIGDFNFGFIGFNDTNSPVKIEQVTALIIKAREEQADFIIINAHWGEEYKEISNKRQRELAHKLIEAGADAIIGHHPHVVQEMEVYQNRPIFYSLGNFVFDQYFSASTQTGLGVSLTFKEKGIGIHILPIVGEKSQVIQMSEEKAINFMEMWLAKSRLDTHEFNDFNLQINL